MKTIITIKKKQMYNLKQEMITGNKKAKTMSSIYIQIQYFLIFG